MGSNVRRYLHCSAATPDDPSNGFND
jgi:hypothetical protein